MFKAGHKRSAPPALIGLLISLSFRGAAAGQSALIPSEDNRWDGHIQKAILEVRRGNFPSGIQILQQVIDAPQSRRFLKQVPEAFVSGLTEALSEAWAESALGTKEARTGPAEAARDPAGDSPQMDASRPAIRLYIPVTEIARQLLAELPPEGVLVYRKLYGELAEELYREALERDDLDLLLRVAEDYFLTPAGLEARKRLAESLFESGWFHSALSLWRALADALPPSIPPRGEGAMPPEEGLTVRFKILKALRLLGRVEEYEAERKGFLAVVGPGGRGDDLEARLRAFEEAQPFPPDAVAVTPGLAAGPPPPLPGRHLGFDWHSPFPLQRGISRVAPFGRPLDRRFAWGAAREPVRAFPFFPAFSTGGEADLLYIGAVFSLKSLSVATGKIVWDYHRQTLEESVVSFQEGSESPVYTVALVPSPHQSSPGTVSPSPGGSVDRGSRAENVPVIISSYLSTMVKFKHYMGYEITADVPTRSLAAVESESGRLLWRTGNLAVGREGKTVSFTTPVLVRGGRVYAGGWQQHGYIDGLLVSLDLHSGAILWHQLVASSQMEGTMFGELAREPLAAAIAEREGVIYYPTNLGAVAALEAVTGRILWLTTYDSIEVKPADGRRSEFRRLVWGVNPPLLLGDTLIVTPRDSIYLYAIDCAGRAGREERRQAGRILWQYPNPNGELRDLLGYVGGFLYFTGPGGVQALDVRGLPGIGPSLAEGDKLLPPDKPPPGVGCAAVPVRLLSPIQRSEEGRGALTDSGVVVVARRGAQALPRNADPGNENRLWLVDLSLKNCLDLSGPVPGSEAEGGHVHHGGNVTVALGRVILTSRDLVVAFSPRLEELER